MCAEDKSLGLQNKSIKNVFILYYVHANYLLLLYYLVQTRLKHLFLLKGSAHGWLELQWHRTINCSIAYKQNSNWIVLKVKVLKIGKIHLKTRHICPVPVPLYFKVNKLIRYLAVQFFDKPFLHLSASVLAHSWFVCL